MRITFQIKFLLTFVLILSLVLGVAGYYLYNQAVRGVEKKFELDFKEGRDAAWKLMTLRMTTLVDKVRVISRAPQIRPLLEDATVDYGTIQMSFAENKESLSSDILIVCSPEGRVQYWADQPEFSGRNIREWPVVAESLKAKDAWGVQIVDTTMVMLAGVPVISSDDQGAKKLSAILVAGQRIDDDLAEDIRKISGMEVIFTHATEIRAATLVTRDREMLSGSIRPAALTEEHYEDINLRGEIFRCGYASLPGEPGVGMLFLSSKDAVLYESLEPIKHGLARAAGFGLIISVIVSFLVARSQARPIGALVEGTKAVERNDFKHRVQVKQYARDELTDLAASFNEMIADLEEKEKMQSVLHMGLGKEIAEAMLKSGVLGGEERKVTMLFSDLRGFTAMSEKMTPHQVIDMLNEYMTRMSACIEAEGGVVDKYVGDEIMALFGAPVDRPDDAVRAVRAAVKKREALKSLNETRTRRGEFEIKVGMGINTGRVVAGNMGSENRRNYTVIGAACNLAARLCSNAAANQILISESTYQEIKDVFQTRKLDPIRVKNVAEPVQIYEVL